MKYYLIVEQNKNFDCLNQKISTFFLLFRIVKQVL